MFMLTLNAKPAPLGTMVDADAGVEVDAGVGASAADDDDGGEGVRLELAQSSIQIHFHGISAFAGVLDTLALAAIGWTTAICKGLFPSY